MQRRQQATECARHGAAVGMTAQPQAKPPRWCAAACVKSQDRNVGSERTLSGGNVFKKVWGLCPQTLRASCGQQLPNPRATADSPECPPNWVRRAPHEHFCNAVPESATQVGIMSRLCCLGNQGAPGTGWRGGRDPRVGRGVRPAGGGAMGLVCRSPRWVKSHVYRHRAPKCGAVAILSYPVLLLTLLVS